MVDLSRIVELVRRAHGAALMGVLNLTPDSFFDGGRYVDRVAATERLRTLVQQGASIVDIGGESTRPGAPSVPAGEQIDRIGWAIDAAKRLDIVVSVDTTNAEVADNALGRGAAIVNDVSCLAHRGLAEVAARHNAVLLLSHSRTAMSEMRDFSEWPDDDYGDIVEDVLAELSAARSRATACGVDPAQVWFDPGLGFSKNARQSLELLRRLGELCVAGAPLVVGPSRKSFIAAVDPCPPEDRLGGTISASVYAMTQGADVIRVHDVQPVRQALMLHLAMSRPAASKVADA